MSAPRFRVPNLTQQQLLTLVEVRLLGDDETERLRFRELMGAHHYLKSDHLVGEQLRYVAHVGGQWVALLSWSAASYHLKDREDWIGWAPAQRRRRLAFMANNARFLILPGIDCPNLASRVLALGTARLSADWHNAYGHPVLAVESFVDSQLFRGTCYKAQGWQLLGATKGFERSRQDYYTQHARPKQLWVRELQPGARRILAAAMLPDALQAVEDKVIPRSEVRVPELRSLWELCRAVPDWRQRKGRDYPLPALLSIVVLATLCGVVRGQRDLAAFASGLTQAQLRALRCYRDRSGRYQYPRETTFQRVLASVDAAFFGRTLQLWEAQLRGPSSGEDDTIIAIDGKAQRGSTPHVKDEQKAQLVSAVSLPGGRVLGTVLVEQKSNEIPAARQLLENLGPLDGRLVMLDALHSNQETIRQIIQGNGADYLLPVKGNHCGLEAGAAACLPDPPIPTAAATATPPPRPRKKKVGKHAAPAPAPGNGLPPPLDPTPAGDKAGARPAVRYRRH
jgi:hypothetical protein